MLLHSQKSPPCHTYYRNWPSSWLLKIATWGLPKTSAAAPSAFFLASAAAALFRVWVQFLKSQLSSPCAQRLKYQRSIHKFWSHVGLERSAAAALFKKADFFESKISSKVSFLRLLRITCRLYTYIVKSRLTTSGRFFFFEAHRIWGAQRLKCQLLRIKCRLYT